MIRHYSLCGDPANRALFQIAVRRADLSRGGSEFAHDAITEGTLLVAQAPRNNFALIHATNYVFVAAGIGITPMLPMISAAEESGLEWSLLYGGRNRPSMPFADSLEGRYGDRVELYPKDSRGRLPLQSMLESVPSGTAVYCCGPEALMSEVEDFASQRDDISVHVERFTARDLSSEPSVPFEVQIHGSGEVFQVPAERSALEVLDESGYPVLSSCGEGVCGTCEVKVLSGDIDHRDSLLSPHEQEANERMFVCVSRARSPRLILDL